MVYMGLLNQHFGLFTAVSSPCLAGLLTGGYWGLAFDVENWLEEGVGVADLWCVMSVSSSSASHGGVGGLEFWGRLPGP
jgi:hypothetical protein